MQNGDVSSKLTQTPDPVDDNSNNIVKNYKQNIWKCCIYNR